MAVIIDRREYSRHKNAENVERYKRRHTKAIREAFSNFIDNQTDKNNTSIKNKKGLVFPIKLTSDKEAYIEVINTSMERIFAENPKYSVGDTWPKEEGSKNGAGSGTNEEGISFSLTLDDLNNMFFNRCELLLQPKNSKDLEHVKFVHAGYQKVGIPANLSIIKTFEQALARQQLFKSYYNKKIESMPYWFKGFGTEAYDIEKNRLMKIRDNIPFFDDIDYRYKFKAPQPVPTTKAVIFCLMDVSGSMGVSHRNIAKTFFQLLSLFVSQKYITTELVFIAHTDTAYLCTEEEFFYSKLSGGTRFQPTYELTAKIIKEKYPTEDYNIFVVHASDGDNIEEENIRTAKYIVDTLLPNINLYIYLTVFNKDYQSELDVNDLFSICLCYYLEANEPTSKFKTASIGSIKNAFDAFLDIFEKKES